MAALMRHCLVEVWSQCDGLTQSGSVVGRHGGTAYRPGKGYANLCPEDGSSVDRGDGFGSEGMRRLPWVCWTDRVLLFRYRVTQWCINN
jgi:hypothetical protein